MSLRLLRNRLLATDVWAASVILLIAPVLLYLFAAELHWLDNAWLVGNPILLIGLTYALFFLFLILMNVDVRPPHESGGELDRLVSLKRRGGLLPRRPLRTTDKSPSTRGN
jgi:hypothetical protein